MGDSSWSGVGVVVVAWYLAFVAGVVSVWCVCEFVDYVCVLAYY